MSALEGAAHEVGKSFSGSWLGYHSRVYYKDLSPVPAGAHFSQEWGLKEFYTDIGSQGAWQEFTSDYVRHYIRQKAGNPDLHTVTEAAERVGQKFEDCKSEILSILINEMSDHEDGFLQGLRERLEKLQPLSPGELAQLWSPKGQFLTRDMVAAGEGTSVPPHIAVRAEVASIRQSFNICKEAADISRKAASHMERKDRRRKVDKRIGTNVFIGHGRSLLWRELKDFIQDRLRLPWDEFNRVPVAGVTNIARLAEMLDSAAIALIIMTGEDVTAEGEIHARLNVVHEAGLFQGKLGFTKAIVLLEEGCTEFSNIQGLGQIRFPRGNISAAFEDVRRVFEREGISEI